nr:hypothetical protein [uncultured Fluviicola sp.]
MRKKLNILFSIFATSYWFCPAFSQKDTIRFVPGITEYDLVLKEQYFVYDTIRPYNGINYYCKLRIKNNSKKTIVLSTVRTNSSGKMLVDLIEPGRNEEIKPGNSFSIMIKPNLKRPGIFNAWASIFYKTGEEEKELKVQVRGYTLPVPQPIDPPAPAPVKVKEPRPARLPIAVKKPVKQPEIQQPAKVQPTYVPRPEGVTRYDPGELTIRRENQRDYSFTFHATPIEHAYGFPPKPKKDQVFSWDTISNDAFFYPISFHLKNDSEYVVTILKIEGSNGDIYYRNTADQRLVYPDSSFTVEAIPNLLNKGHFYHSLIIQYQSYYGIQQFELKQWIYIPSDLEAISHADSLKLTGLRNTFYAQKNNQKTDPFRLYVISGGQLNYKNARLELFSKESSAIIHSEEDPQGNRFFQIHRNGWDTLLIHVLSPNGEVVQKTRFIHPFEYDSYSIPFFPFTGPYTYNHRKSPYKKLDGIYWLEQHSDHFHYPDSAIIKKYTANAHIRFLENGTVEIKDPVEAIVLEKKLFRSPLKIRLLPVAELTSGDGIRWYSNTFTVMFYEHVSEEQIKKIFAKYGILHYSKQDYGYKDENNWTFSLEYILDRKYMVLLDQLWQLKEVSGIIQEKHQIHGLN